jgi:hypothetical protein
VFFWLYTENIKRLIVRMFGNVKPLYIAEVTEIE